MVLGEVCTLATVQAMVWKTLHGDYIYPHEIPIWLKFTRPYILIYEFWYFPRHLCFRTIGENRITTRIEIYSNSFVLSSWCNGVGWENISQKDKKINRFCKVEKSLFVFALIWYIIRENERDLCYSFIYGCEIWNI